MPLSEIALRNLKPDVRTVRVTDERGLYIEISPAGGRWWRFKYRFAGKEKRLSLGVYPEVSLKTARLERDDARALLRQGIDPSARRKQDKLTTAVKSSSSFELVARDWFARKSPGWAPGHSSKLIRRLERYIFPYLGSRPIADITAPELLAAIRRVEKHALDAAHRTLRECGMVFRYGIATGRCSRDVAADLRGALPPYTSGHFAATLDPNRLGGILRTMEQYPGSPVVRSAMRLAPMLFVRPGELRHAEWASIDLEKAEWRFVASKRNLDHLVPLCTQAVEILTELHKLTGEHRYVFPSARKGSRPMSNMAVLAAMRSVEIGREEMTAHGFRAVARTLLDEELGFRPDIIEHQLAHAVRDPNGRAYNRTSHLPERRRMMQVWADHLDEIKRRSREDGQAISE